MCLLWGVTVGGGGGVSQKGKGVATKWEWVGIKGDKGAESRSQCRFSGLISARVKKNGTYNEILKTNKQIWKFILSEYLSYRWRKNYARCLHIKNLKIMNFYKKIEDSWEKKVNCQVFVWVLDMKIVQTNFLKISFRQYGLTLGRFLHIFLSQRIDWALSNISFY